MATFKHISSKNANYGDAEKYLTFAHDEFTMKPTLDADGRLVPREDYRISTLNCGEEDFAVACMRSNLRYGKNQKREDVKSHHYIISFDPRDGPDNGLTVDKAQELGERFCREQFPGHQAIVCTHPDGHNHSGNIHVHIVINSLRIENVPLLPYMDRPADTKAGCKHRCTDAAMEYFKSEVMELCHEAGLYQIDLLNGSANRVSGAMSGQSLLIEVTISSSVYGDVVQRIYIDLVYRNTNPDFRFESSELTKVYGDEDFTVAAIGAAEGSSVTYRSGDETVATVDSSGKVHIVGAGSTRITAISAETADYQETEASYMLRVERRQVEIPDADTTVFVYNGMEQTYRLAAGEDYTITGSLTQTNANEAGYPIIVSLKDKANTKWANSEDDTADKTYRFVIRKADAAVTAMDRNAHVGDTVPVLPTQPVKSTDYIVSGLFGDDILTGTVLLDYADTPDMNKPGETAIRITGTLTGENYNVTYVPGKLIVTHSAASCDHVWDSGKVTTPATCTEKGVKTYTCTKDSSHTKTEEIPAQGHDPVQHEAKAPTCTESGWEAYETCSRCDYTTYKEKAALGHDLEYHPAKAATTAAEGNTEYWYCKACGKYFSGKEGAKEISQADTVIARLKEDPKSPQTGDTSNLALWFALLLMSSAAAIGATVAVGKKRTTEN